MSAYKHTMTIRPEKLDDWNNGLSANKDAYGRRCFTYADEWAARMEAAIAKCETVEGCAKRCSREADTDGITGFMYGDAVSILAQCWMHGEALRRWHNIDTQIGHEGEKANESGGTLNPALLSIG